MQNMLRKKQFQIFFKMKKLVQNLIRFLHLIFFKKNLPTKIALYFHNIEKDEIEDIKFIIKFFKYLNYNFYSITDFNYQLENSTKSISLTFDDGFKSWINLIEIFEKENIHVTFFLNSVFLEPCNDLSRFYYNINTDKNIQLLDFKDIELLISKGHEIGAHTHSHETSSCLSDKNFQVDIEENLNYLRKFNMEINSFAIPFGRRRYIKNSQLNYLRNIFSIIVYGEPGMLFDQKLNSIQRYPWNSKKSFNFNLNNIRINSSFCNNLTKRSGLG